MGDAGRINWKAIDANVIGLEGLEAELAEIDENLMRNELTPIQAGTHLNRRDEILDALGLRAKVGQGRPSENGETVSPLKTTAEIASAIGFSERSAQQYKQIARDIAPDVQETIEASLPDLASSTTQLLELSRMDDTEQREIVDDIASGESKTVASA